MHSRGFTLVELLIVLTITGILFLLVGGIGSNVQPKNQLRVEQETVTEYLRRAQARSINGKADTTWGVHMTSIDVTLFAGDSYATRDTIYDEVHALETSVLASGLTDVVFDGRVGTTDTSGTITLTSTTTADQLTVTVSSQGTIE